MPQVANLRVAKAAGPTLVNGTVPPRRRPNAALRSREHLTPDEVQQLISAAGKRGRYGHRDTTLIMLAYRHGLRVGEIVALRWEQVDLKAGLLHVVRLKKGLASTHPLRGPEIRALRRLQREQRPSGPYVFTTERRGPLTTAAVRKIVTLAGRAARLYFRSTLTCCDTGVDSSWQTRATTPERSSSISDIGTLRIPFATRSWRQTGLKISGEIDRSPRRSGNFTLGGTSAALRACSTAKSLFCLATTIDEPLPTLSSEPNADLPGRFH
jgi:hypothetical protein